MKQRKQRTHTFPKTYTTIGAIYRGKKNFERMFPDSSFVVVKQDGKFILERIVNEVVSQETNVESVNI